MAEVKPHIAFLDIGLMGLPMATRLLKAGYPLTAWNRTAAKAEPLRALGAQIAATPADAVRHASVCISMLENGPITQAVLHSGVLTALPVGSLWIDMASTQPKEARENATHLDGRGIHALDAPVSGGTVGAVAGSLAIMAGGHDEAFARALPILEHLGRPTHVGPVGAGQLCKLANQLVVGVTIGAVAEALHLVQGGGGDPAKFIQAITGGWADSKIMQTHGPRMLAQDFAKRGAMAVQLKDLNNVAAEAQAAGLGLPISQLTQSLFAKACQDPALADLDHSALYLALERRIFR